jgi:hypothetical protein
VRSCCRSLATSSAKGRLAPTLVLGGLRLFLTFTLPNPRAAPCFGDLRFFLLKNRGPHERGSALPLKFAISLPSANLQSLTRTGAW